jgi:hypothetical protein
MATDPTPLAERTATIQRSSGPVTPQGPEPPAPADPLEPPTGDPDRYQSAGERARGGLGRVIRAHDLARAVPDRRPGPAPGARHVVEDRPATPET